MNVKELINNGTYIGGSFFPPKKSLQVILDNLGENEGIIIVTSCIAEGRAGAVALTNRRLIFGSKVMMSSAIKDFYLSKLTSVTYKSELTDKLEVKGSSDELTMKSINKGLGQKFVNKIKELQTDDTKNEGLSSGLDDLEKLASLKDKGIITEEEFAAKKKQLLGI